MPFRAVLFDIDGTLVDSNDAHAHAWVEADIIHAALEQARCEAAEAVMIGDTPYDVEAATRAGVRVIAFRCGGCRDEDLRGAIAIYDGPADLLVRLDESPLSRQQPAPTLKGQSRAAC